MYTALEKEHLKSKLILQVHDELIIDAYKSELDVIKKLVKTQMESAAKMDVKLTADVEYGCELV